MKSEEMTRRALDTMDRLNKKHCQEELERIKTNIYPDTKFDCSKCQFANPDAKTAFLTELTELLRKYNANIEPTGYEIEGLYIGINNNKDGVYYKMDEYSPIHELTPDNIFDYEK